jgi:hypothetical protein
LKISHLGTLEVYGHCEARGELPEPSDVRDALDLPGSGFTMTGSAMDRSRLCAFSYGWKVLFSSTTGSIGFSDFMSMTSLPTCVLFSMFTRSSTLLAYLLVPRSP